MPEQLAREGQANGLLTPEALQRMLGQEMLRRRVGELFDAADRLGAVPEPPLTEAEILAEIQVQCAERRAAMRLVDTNEADPDDDAVLACAVAAHAEAVASGDPHLLQLSPFQGIPIHAYLMLALLAP